MGGLGVLYFPRDVFLSPLVDLRSDLWGKSEQNIGLNMDRMIINVIKGTLPHQLVALYSGEWTAAPDCPLFSSRVVLILVLVLGLLKVLIPGTSTKVPKYLECFLSALHFFQFSGWIYIISTWPLSSWVWVMLSTLKSSNCATVLSSGQHLRVNFREIKKLETVSFIIVPFEARPWQRKLTRCWGDRENDSTSL